MLGFLGPNPNPNLGSNSNLNLGAKSNIGIVSNSKMIQTLTFRTGYLVDLARTLPRHVRKGGPMVIHSRGRSERSIEEGATIRKGGMIVVWGVGETLSRKEGHVSWRKCENWDQRKGKQILVKFGGFSLVGKGEGYWPKDAWKKFEEIGSSWVVKARSMYSQLLLLSPSFLGP